MNHEIAFVWQEDEEMRRKQALVLGGTWFLLTLMCVTLPTPTPPPERSGDPVATMVAATLTAMVPADRGDETEAPSAGSLPGETPVAGVTSPPPTEAPSSVRLKLVYTDRGRIIGVDTRGTSRPLGTAENVSRVMLTDDGTRVVFFRSADPTYPERREIWVIHSDGTGERRLLSAEDVDALHPRDPGTYLAIYQAAMIPGTRGLLFNTWVLHEGPGLIVSADLFYLDVDTGALVRLLDKGESGFAFALAPNGRYLALIHPKSIDLARLDGPALGDLRRDVLTYPAVMTYSEYAFIPDVTWRPDSTAFGVVIPPPDPLAPDLPPLRFWRVAVDGSATLLGELAGHQGVLSPDLQWVVVMRNDDLLLARSDGSGARLYRGGGFLWSPNSRYFAGFTSMEPRALVIGRIDGDPVTFSLGTEAGLDFRWVSGDTFYFWVGRRDRGSWRLVRGRVDGTLETVVTVSEEFASYDVLP